MFRNRVVLTFMVITLGIGMVGCTKSNSNTEASTTTTQNSNGQGRKGINFVKADVYGEVSDIIGNEINLKLLEQPTKPSGGNGQGRGQGQQGQGTSSGTQGSQGSENGQGTGQNGQGRGGFGGFTKKYTGKEQTIVIPVGVPIVIMARGDNGMTETNITINEIVKGGTLSIFYEKGTTTIEKVRFQKARTGGGGNVGSGGRGND